MDDADQAGLHGFLGNLLVVQNKRFVVFRVNNFIIPYKIKNLAHPTDLRNLCAINSYLSSSLFAYAYHSFCYLNNCNCRSCFCP